MQNTFNLRTEEGQRRFTIMIAATIVILVDIIAAFLG
jgi:hypothetical protein